ncbi:hypothetical protein J2T08_002716 [Neorhizobium galegae]|nr:hypothetical protein [Neorhizobium galegae]MBP2561796.1 hypothetical protein [Neorhizobium galegae]MDQ0134798.1 hypothetical protein [Neorhizobium galegae]
MQKVDALVGRLVGDLGAGVSGVLVVLGDHHFEDHVERGFARPPEV